MIYRKGSCKNSFWVSVAHNRFYISTSWSISISYVIWNENLIHTFRQPSQFLYLFTSLMGCKHIHSACLRVGENRSIPEFRDKYLWKHTIWCLLVLMVGAYFKYWRSHIAHTIIICLYWTAKYFSFRSSWEVCFNFVLKCSWIYVQRGSEVVSAV